MIPKAKHAGFGCQPGMRAETSGVFLFALMLAALTCAHSGCGREEKIVTPERIQR